MLYAVFARSESLAHALQSPKLSLAKADSMVKAGYMTLPGPSVPGRQFLERHSNPNPNPNPDPNPIPNPVQELTVHELT